MEKWLKTAIEIQSLAQAGLAYTDNVYDRERYERLREIAAEMLADKAGLPLGKVKDLFCNETGYQTPKLDTRAAIFRDDKILLVHENNGTWALPGGWCDVLESVQSNTQKYMRTDIRENDNGYVMEVELPGVDKKDIDIDLRDGYLNISVNKNDRYDDGRKDNYIHRERSFSCSRSYYVGDIDKSAVKAKYENGILTVDIPKNAPDKPENRIEIE